MRNSGKRTVVVLNGSPRLRGNTAVLVEWLEAAMRRRGLGVRHVDLYRMSFRGCAHCDHCKKHPDRPACKLKDEFTPVLDEIAGAATIVAASPVYCWAVSGCLSAALDRFYSLYKSTESLIKGKKIAGVFSAGGDEFDGMDLCVDMLKRISQFGGANYVGTLAGKSCSSPAELRHRAALKREAASLAKLL